MIEKSGFFGQSLLKRFLYPTRVAIAKIATSQILCRDVMKKVLNILPTYLVYKIIISFSHLKNGLTFLTTFIIYEISKIW